MKYNLSLLVLMALSALLIAGCSKEAKEASLEEIKTGGFNAGASVHDPSIVLGRDGHYYIFGSHMEAAVSDDLREWKSFASGVDAGNPLFDNLFSGDMDAFAYVGKHVDGYYAVWAPDVIYNTAMHKWVMYFCTSHDYRTSNICFATADSIKGPYTYKDTFLYSGFTSETVKKTNFYEIMGETADVSKYLSNGDYNNLVYPNCIDPSVFYDKDGKLWMVYGSWSGGIYLLQIDETTGCPIHPKEDEANRIDPYFGKYLIGGLHNSCEGPYIIYNEASDYYYLLVSYGSLVREGGYQIRCFRSRAVDGPYMDASGNSLGMVSNHDKYGVKMMGNYTFPSLSYTYMAPGHCSAFFDSDGKMYVVYHQRFNNGSEYHEPRVHQLFLNKSGWLVAAPFAVNGETLKEEGYSVDEIIGTYYYLNHGTDISAEVHEYNPIRMKKDGSIISDGEEQGHFELEAGTPYVQFNLNGIVFDGIMLQMTDEAGNDVICFSAVGTNNETIWGVHYQKKVE